MIVDIHKPDTSTLVTTGHFYFRLLAGGALGWILGRNLRSDSPPVPAKPKIHGSESSMFPRMADKVVSSVLAEALALIAAKVRRFSNLTNPAKD